MIIYSTNGPKLLDLIYAEHLAMLPDSAKDAMVRSLKNSPNAWVAYHDETLLGFCGLIPPTLLSETAYLWLYATAEFSKHRFLCARYSRHLIEDVLNHYPVVVGHCVDRSPACKWLRWLGATFREPQGELIPFEIKAP